MTYPRAPLDLSGLSEETVRRFWRRLRRGDEDEGECWRWPGARTARGYGTVTLDGRRVLVHRAAWALAHGGVLPHDDSPLVLQTCGDPLCGNPRHLYRDRAGAGSVARLAGQQCKLTAEQVRVIRGRYGRGGRGRPSLRQLAAEYGVSPRCIADVVARRTWRSVPRERCLPVS